MARKQRLFFICLGVATLNLMAGFYLADRIILVATVLLPMGAMLFARKPACSWLAHFSLAGYAGLSAAGILLNIPLMLMVLATKSALASWDLVLEMNAVLPTTKAYDRLHLLYLGAAIGLGLLGVTIFHWIHWRFSFGGMLALGIGLLVCLYQMMNYSKNNKESQL